MWGRRVCGEHCFCRSSRPPSFAFPVASLSVSAPRWPLIPYSGMKSAYTSPRVIIFRNPYSGNNLLYSLFVTLHFQECLDLADCEVLPVAKRNQLIESTKKFVCILQNFSFIQGLACACNDLCEKMEGVDVLEDVGLAIRNENHVEFVKRLVHKTDIILFNGCMLSTRVCQLGERGKEGFNS